MVYVNCSSFLSCYNSFWKLSLRSTRFDHKRSDRLHFSLLGMLKKLRNVNVAALFTVLLPQIEQPTSDLRNDVIQLMSAQCDEGSVVDVELGSREYVYRFDATAGQSTHRLHVSLYS